MIGLYSKTKQEGKRLLAYSELMLLKRTYSELMLLKRNKRALDLAKQAQKKLKKNSPEYIRAGDIISMMKNKK